MFYVMVPNPKVERTSLFFILETLGALLLFPIIAFILKRVENKQSFITIMRTMEQIGNLKS